jgi:signal transduction histidine kinase/ActR/RegA family two-component response regulator
MTKEEYIKEKYEKYLYYWTNVAIGSGGFVVLSLIPLDYLASPSNLKRFLVYRIITTICLFILFLINRIKVDIRHQHILINIGGACVAVMVAVMISHFGGHQSVYFAGYLVIVIFLLGFVPLTFKASLFTAFMFYSIYVVPILLYETITNKPFFISANIFLIASAASMVLLRYLFQKRLEQEFGLQYELEQYQNRLEEQVKERTAQLSATVSDLESEIVERKKLEEQLLHAEKMKAVGTLTGGIAHEFNNILSSIIGYGEMLKEMIHIDDPSRKYVDIICDSGMRASKLTGNLLAFSRKQVIRPHPVRINSVLKEADILLSKVIGEDIAIKTVLSDKDPLVHIDQGQLEQILLNLATNARDAMPKGGSLTIESGFVEMNDETVKARSYREPGTYAVISVTDSGIGMDDDTRARIFEPFFTTKAVGKGTGLGLSTVYGIVKQNNGYIDVYSETGMGTTFKIYLPMIQAENESTAPALREVPSIKGSETILVAEDDKVVREYIIHIFESAGYKTIAAENGEDALQKFLENHNRIHLLLLDVIMPMKNGKEVFDEARKMKPAVKALFLSGYSENIIHTRGILEKGIEFLPKPISKNDLLMKIRTILDEQA